MLVSCIVITFNAVACTVHGEVDLELIDRLLIANALSPFEG
jgi:hypothetical protein